MVNHTTVCICTPAHHRVALEIERQTVVVLCYFDVLLCGFGDWRAPECNMVAKLGFISGVRTNLYYTSYSPHDSTGSSVPPACRRGIIDVFNRVRTGAYKTRSHGAVRGMYVEDPRALPRSFSVLLWPPCSLSDQRAQGFISFPLR